MLLTISNEANSENCNEKGGKDVEILDAYVSKDIKILRNGLLLMARSNLLVPAERKKNFNFFLSERED